MLFYTGLATSVAALLAFAVLLRLLVFNYRNKAEDGGDPIKAKPWTPTGRISAVGGGHLFANPDKPADFRVITEEKRMNEDDHGVSRQEVQWRKVTQREMSLIIKRYNEYVIKENLTKGFPVPGEKPAK